MPIEALRGIYKRPLLLNSHSPLIVAGLVITCATSGRSCTSPLPQGVVSQYTVAHTKKISWPCFSVCILTTSIFFFHHLFIS